MSSKILSFYVFALENTISYKKTRSVSHKSHRGTDFVSEKILKAGQFCKHQCVSERKFFTAYQRIQMLQGHLCKYLGAEIIKLKVYKHGKIVLSYIEEREAKGG